MTGRTVVAVCVGAAVLAVGIMMVRSSAKSGGADNYAAQTLQPVNEQLAAKAQESCWFKVKNRSSRASEVQQWQAVSPTSPKTERWGELLIVTGGLLPGVGDDHFYGCSLFEYTAGSPVVMTAKTAPGPLRTDNLIPFGFTPDGRKQQR